MNEEITDCRYRDIPDYIKKNPDIDFSSKERCVAKLKRGNSEIHIQEHALDSLARDIEKYNLDIDASKKVECLDIICRLLRKNARELERRNTVHQIIEHGFKLADYFRNEGWILVIEEGGLLKTVYYQEVLKKEIFRFKRDN